jgi:CheY-like chemotaxis protein
VSIKGTILVVEDEPAVRKVIRSLLVARGHTVLEASDGREALALWERHKEEIDLVYTDVEMPGGLTGLDLAGLILADKPNLKVIVTSGYHTDLVDLSKITEPSIIYLPKPCDADTFHSVVERCFQRG